MVMLALTLILILAVQFATLWRLHKMSKAADLATAVQSLTTAVTDLATRIGNLTTNVTPDAEVQTQVDAVNQLTTQVNSLAQ